MATSLTNTAGINFAGTDVTAQATALLASEPTVTKTVTPTTAVTGTVLSYTVTITNTDTDPLIDIEFTDTLPAGVTYDTGSFHVNGTVQTPTVTGNVITYIIPSLAVGANTVTLSATVS